MIRIEGRSDPAFLGDVVEVRTQSIAGVDGGPDAGLSGQKTSFAQMGFRLKMGLNQTAPAFGVGRQVVQDQVQSGFTVPEKSG